MLIELDAGIPQSRAPPGAHQHTSPIIVGRDPSAVALHSLNTALEGLPLREMLWEFAAAGAEPEGLLHLLEHFLVVAESDPSSFPLNSRPV